MTILLAFCAIVLALYYLQALVYKRFWDKSLTVDVSFSKRDVFEGEYVVLIEKISNNKRLPLPYVRISHKLPQNLARADNGEDYTAEERISVFVVPPKKTVTKKTRLHCLKRGYYRIVKADLSCSNIFFSEDLKKVIGIESSVIVYPRESPIEDFDIPSNNLFGDYPVNRFILPDPFVYRGIREYMPTDSFKQINFKSWARTGKPMSNVYGFTVSCGIKIYINFQKYNEFLRENVFEEAIRLAAFLARKFLADGVSVGLASSGLDCVTNKPCFVRSGSSQQNLLSIYEALAAIDLNLYLPIMDFLREESSGNDTIILISSYWDDEITEFYNERIKNGKSMVWVIPRLKTDKGELPEGDSIIKWEVGNE